ncbi:hypothetical protein [Nocardioides sp. LHG3406-4]|uniref:hypothetical protein n=1 Tax=Nocardioides sp. LHG3406-4 TaxID=2804575 RepID=UPI003CF07535
MLGKVTTPTRRVGIRIPAVQPPPALGTRENPFPIATGFTQGDWGLVLSPTDTDAWPEIRTANMFNEAPLNGWAYVTVPVTFTYRGATQEAPWLDVDIDFLGSDGVIYDRMSGDQWCGVIPNSSDDIDDLYPGASATGNECAVVPTSAIVGGLWRISTEYDEYVFAKIA